jgi:hypothetical protein
MIYQMNKKPAKELTEAEKHALYKQDEAALAARKVGIAALNTLTMGSECVSFGNPNMYNKNTVEPAVSAGFTFGSASIQTEICEDALKVKYHNELEYVNKRIKEMIDIAIDLAQFKLDAATHDLINERLKDIKQLEFRTNLDMEALETRVNAKLSDCMHRLEEHKDIILRYSTGTQAVYDEMKALKKLFYGARKEND